jgi:hypothetical protein
MDEFFKEIVRILEGLAHAGNPYAVKLLASMVLNKG